VVVFFVLLIGFVSKSCDPFCLLFAAMRPALASGLITVSVLQHTVRMNVLSLIVDI
jgi:hypothetical protein